MAEKADGSAIGQADISGRKGGYSQQESVVYPKTKKQAVFGVHICGFITPKSGKKALLGVSLFYSSTPETDKTWALGGGSFFFRTPNTINQRV